MPIAQARNKTGKVEDKCHVWITMAGVNKSLGQRSKTSRKKSEPCRGQLDSGQSRDTYETNVAQENAP